jgi:hypothetical protein
MDRAQEVAKSHLEEGVLVHASVRGTGGEENGEIQTACCPLLPGHEAFTLLPRGRVFGRVFRHDPKFVSEERPSVVGKRVSRQEQRACVLRSFKRVSANDDLKWDGGHRGACPVLGVTDEAESPALSKVGTGTPTFWTRVAEEPSSKSQ